MMRIKDIRCDPVAIISDDLTGANEIGLVLAEHLNSNLVLNSTSSTGGLDPLIKDYAGVVVNLNTRDCSGEKARRRISEALQNNPQLRSRLIYKKIDSTLRGNLIEELEAILDNSLADIIILVPASPQTQRFTAGGYHLVGGRPVALTEYAGELSVSGTSYLPDLLGRTPKYKVRSISLRQLAAGCQNVEQFIKDSYQAGFRILVCDACSQRDLWVIRDAILNSPLQILPVGSAALFQEFFSLESGPCEDPCMVICGSLNRQSRLQVQKLIDGETVSEILINFERALGEHPESEIDRTVQLATAFYKENRNLLIHTPATPFSPNSELGKTCINRIPSDIGRLIGNIVARLLDNLRISGLILTGGNIAAEVIKQIGGTGIILNSELRPFVPIGHLAGGPLDGLRVVTKGGGVGDPDCLVRAVNYLRYNR